MAASSSQAMAGLIARTSSVGLPPIQPIRRAQLVGGTTAHASLRDAQELVQLKIIRPIAHVDAHQLLCKEGYKLLDVRPVWEWEKAFVQGSLHIPLFVEDEDSSYLTLFKRSIQMGYGGVWMGQRLTTRNTSFLEQVNAAVPDKDQKVLVACGEGLRSLLALDDLHGDGYTSLAWLCGGFSSMRGADSFPDVGGSTKLQYANIGGVAEFLLKFVLFVQGILSNATKAENEAKDTAG